MDKLESMVLEAETVSALMIQMADDDVGDTSFAVMLDFGENGTEHECDLGVHETALRASAVIDALLAELEAKDKRIAELEAKLSKMPKACDGKEQDAFIKFALNNKFSTECHPLHFLFLDKQTSAARRAWGAAIAYCRDTVEGDEQ